MYYRLGTIWYRQTLRVISIRQAAAPACEQLCARNGCRLKVIKPSRKSDSANRWVFRRRTFV